MEPCLYGLAACCLTGTPVGQYSCSTAVGRGRASTWGVLDSWGSQSQSMHGLAGEAPNATAKHTSSAAKL